MKTSETDWARTWKIGAGDDMRTPAEWMTLALKASSKLEALRQVLGSQADAGEIIRVCQQLVSED